MATTYAAAIPSTLKKFNQLETSAKKTEHLQGAVIKVAKDMELIKEELEYREDGLPFLKDEIDELEGIVARLSDEQRHLQASSQLLPADIKQLEQVASEALQIIQDIIRKGPYEPRDPYKRNPKKRQREEDTEMADDTELKRYHPGRQQQ
ncbi:hypothetical protein LQW54_008329 [Pestalotiopsis sp. IQ-011]